MRRCSHLYESGPQCGCEALEGSDFCEDHDPRLAFVESSAGHPLQRLILRLVALVLLVMFLIPFYETAKALYLDAVKLGEETP